MAKNCPPFNPNGNFMASLEKDDPDGWVTGAINHQLKAGRIEMTRKGWDAEMSAQIRDELARMVNVAPDAILDYITAKGWLTKTGKLGGAVFDGDNAAFAVGFLKTYIQGTAVGARELGNAFIAKANNGFDATVEGMKFAQQLKAISKLGEVVVGIDQKAGRTVRASRTDIRSGMAANGKPYITPEDEALIRQEGFTDVLTQISKDLQDPVNSARAINRLVDLAQQVQFVDRPDQISRATMNLTQIGSEVVAEYMVNSLLSSPATLGAAASGVIWVPLRAMLSIAGSPVLAFAGGGEAAVTTAQQGMAGLAAMRQSFTESLALGWHAFKTEKSVYQKVRPPGIRAYMDDPDIQRLAAAQGDETAQGIVNLVNGVGKFTRWPSRVLLGLDEAARHMASRAEVAQRGVRNAFDEGIDPGDNVAIRARVTQEMEDAFTLQTVGGKQRRAGIQNIYEMESAKKYGGTVEQYAARGTFQEDNFIAKKFSGFLDNHPYLRPFMPFVKTPLNILNQGLMVGQTKTALGNLLGVALDGSGGTAAARVARLQEMALKNPQESALTAGQLGMTTLMAAAAYQMATATDDDGHQLMSGGGPSRWMGGKGGAEAQASWEAAGNVRYSFRSGDTVIPYDRFGEPFATVLRMVTDIATVSAFLDETEKDTAMAAVATVTVTGLWNSSFLSGFGNFLDLVMSVQEPAVFDKMFNKNVRNYINSFTPMGGLLGYVERLDDPYRAAYEPGGIMDLFGDLEQQIGNGALASAARRIPGNDLPMQYDQILGEPIPLYPGMGPEGINAAEMAVPLFGRKVDEANPAVKAWNEVVGSFRRYKPHSGTPEFQLTVEEEGQLAQIMGKIKIGGLTFSQAILRVYNKKEVQAYLATRGVRYGKLSPDNPFAEEMSKLRTLYGKAAYNQMLGTSDSLFAREAARIELKEAEEGLDGGLVIEKRDALRGLYKRARTGG